MAWTKLKEYRRKIQAADNNIKTAYSNPALLITLMQGLPTEYKTTKDSLCLRQDLLVDKKN